MEFLTPSPHRPRFSTTVTSRGSRPLLPTRSTASAGSAKCMPMSREIRSSAPGRRGWASELSSRARSRSPRAARTSPTRTSSPTMPGRFIGELAQLSGRPSLVDAEAKRRPKPCSSSLAAAARSDGAGSRARRAHHARADPAPRRPARERRRRPGDRRPRRRRRRAAAARISQRATAIRTSALDPDTRLLREDAGRALPRRSAPAADRAVPERQAAAQSRARASSRAASAWSADRSRPCSTTWPSSAPGRPGSRRPSMRPRKACRCIVLDCRAFGGQAGASARIENYLGFPTGITGMALMARAYNQAQKFGVEMAIPDEVMRLQAPAARRRRFLLDAGRRRDACSARAVVIASGARYRRLDVENLAAFEGSSRALLGLAARGAAVRRAGGGAGRRRQLRRPGGRLSGEPGRQGLAPGARRQPGGDACRATWSSASTRSRTSRC